MQGQAALLGAVLDGKYRITRMIGKGGMGAVYHAQHLGTGRPVAVKVLLSALVRSSEALERFRREARAAGRLRHPNIVDVTDFGVARVGEQDVAYLVMEYLEGSTLRAVIDARGALPLEVVVDIVEQIGVAVGQAHAAGIVHRDLKPDNVWLVNDARGGFTVRVLDFGIARLAGEATVHDTASKEVVSSDTPTLALTAPADLTLEKPADDGSATAVTPSDAVDAEADTARLTTAGSLIGTPLYMSPEQCLGHDVDPRTDVYSLGVIAYEALSGRRPFDGSFREVIDQHLHRQPPPLKAVPSRVAAVVARAMAKSPDERHSSPQALAGSLRVASEGAGLIVRRSVGLYAERLDEFLRIAVRASWPAVALSLATVALAIIVAVIVVLIPDAPRWARVVAAVPIFMAPLLWAVVTVMTNATFAAAIERLRLRPLERVDADEMAADVRQRVGLPATAGFVRTVRRLGWYYLRCEMRAKAGTGDLAFLIGFLEGMPIAEIPQRCALLAADSKQAYKRVQLGIFVALFALPFVEAAVIALMLRPIGVHALPVAVLVAISLVPLNAMLVNPIFSSALALLYFRARQARGEDVALAAVLPGRL